MKNYIAAFASYTIAGKAKNALEINGYEARLIRTPKTLSAGCGYSVVTNAGPECFTKIFDEAGVKYRAVSESR